MAESRRVAIVTGGTRGIGAAITRRLLRDGFNVLAGYRSDVDAALRFEQELDVGELEVRQFDVTEDGQCRAVVAEVIATHGRLDAVVNNAGGVIERQLSELSASDWDLAVRLNLSSVFYMTSAALEPMVSAGYGRIVNVSSVAALMGSPFQIDYASAKAGLIGLTRSLARSVARSGITVNCVVPGGVRTELLDDLTMTPSAAIARTVPLGRFGEPYEIAHIVSALVHADASYVTGAIIAVDGGLSMGL